MTHIDDALLNEYLDRQLDTAVLAQVEEHLTTCAACQARLEEMERLFVGLADLPEVPLMVDLSQQVVARISAEFKPRPIPRWTFPIIGLQMLAVLALVIWLWPSIQPELAGIGRTVPQTAEQLLPDFSLSEAFEPLISGIESLGELGAAVSPDSPLPILEGFLIIGAALVIWLAGSGLVLSRSFVIRNNRG